jgi:hypothetical protein
VKRRTAALRRPLSFGTAFPPVGWAQQLGAGMRGTALDYVIEFVAGGGAVAALAWLVATFKQREN